MKRMAIGCMAALCVTTYGEAGATMMQNGDAWTASGTAYEAHIDGQGRLARLTAGGRSFVAATDDVPHGVRTLWNEPVPFSPARRVDERAIETQSNRGRIRYVFGAAVIEVTVTNAGTGPLFLFLPVAADVRALAGDDGKPAATPLTQTARTSCWYSAETKLTVMGGDRVWGPWNGTQVWEAAVAAGETRRIALSFAALLPDETKAVKSLAPTASLAVAVASPPMDMSVASPLDYQVFQRHSRTTGRLFVRGRVNIACDRIEVRIKGTSADGKALAEEWRPLASALPLPDFDGALPLPAGGWYQVALQAMQGDRVVVQASVPHVGVGEVFVIAGQSNASNYGEERQSPATGRVSTFSGSEWRLADDPQPGVQDTSGCGSPWPVFGDALVARIGVPVAVASTACGATRARLWAPGSPLFTGLMTRILQLGPHGFRAVLWHQGESDGNQSPPHQSTAPDEYRALLTGIIRTSQTMAGWEIPWFTACATYHVPADPGCPAIRDAQKALWASDVSLPGPDTDRLTGDHREQGGRFVHFSEKGLREHGRLWAESVGAYLDKVMTP